MMPWYGYGYPQNYNSGKLYKAVMGKFKPGSLLAARFELMYSPISQGKFFARRLQKKSRISTIIFVRKVMSSLPGVSKVQATGAYPFA